MSQCHNFEYVHNDNGIDSDAIVSTSFLRHAHDGGKGHGDASGGGGIRGVGLCVVGQLVGRGVGALVGRAV